MRLQLLKLTIMFFMRLLATVALAGGCWTAHAQQGSYNMLEFPDCQFYISMTTASSTAAYDNRTKGCTDWAIAYNSTGFTGLTLTVQTAPNASGVPGSYSTYTATSGSNPSTATTSANAVFTGYFPFLRVTLSGLTGTGTVTGTIYGWRFRPSGSSVISGNVSVIGPDAPGSPSTENPVQVAGNDGTNVRAIRTDTVGNSQVVGPGASAAALVGAPVRVGLSDTTNTQNWLTASSLADAGTGAGAGAVGMIAFNGTTFDKVRGNTVGLFVQGPAASGAASTMNPLVIAGILEGAATLIAPSMVTVSGDTFLGVAPGRNTSGILQPLALDTSGGLRLSQGTTVAADNSTNSLPVMVGAGGTNFVVETRPSWFDGSTWDRAQGNALFGLLIAGQGSGAAPTLYGTTMCDSSAVITVTAGATTELVSLVAGDSVRVCGFSITADTALSTARFVSGTGASCGTSQTNRTGAYNLGVATMVSQGSGVGELFKTPVADALCLTAAVGTISGVVSYARY